MNTVIVVLLIIMGVLSVKPPRLLLVTVSMALLTTFIGIENSAIVVAIVLGGVVGTIKSTVDGLKVASWLLALMFGALIWEIVL